MFNLIKMDIRRLLKSRSFYITLAVTAALLALMVAMVSAVADQEKLDALESTGMVATNRSSEEFQEELRGMTQVDFVCECLGSGFLLMIACIGVTLFAHGDFSSGYIKNICFARPRRWEYVLSKVLVAGVYSAVITILGVLVSLVCPVLLGLRLEASSFADIFRYAFWRLFPTWAFSLLGLALVLLTRSSTLGIALAVLGGGGVVGMLVYNLCNLLGWPDLSAYLLSNVERVLCVPMPAMDQISMILACSLGWAAVYAAGSLLVVEKRDI